MAAIKIPIWAFFTPTCCRSARRDWNIHQFPRDSLWR